MKIIVRSILFTACLVGLIGCSSQSTPENTAQSALQAISSGDVAEAEKYFTSEFVNGDKWATVPFETFVNNCNGITTDLTYMVSDTGDHSVYVNVFYGTERVIPIALTQIGDDWYISSIPWENCEILKR